MNRRTFARCLAIATLCPAASRAAPSELEQKRLQNRLELWSNYARRTENLLARITTTRETSLLESPLVVTGTLAFEAPSTLVLRDDGLTGSTTRITHETASISPNRSDAPAGSTIERHREPAAAWLADRLLRMFAPGEEEGLIAGARTHVPRGRGYRLELMPPRGSRARKAVRSIGLVLDPVAGAITEITILEAQGDRLHLRLTDHRQNVPAEDIRSVTATSSGGSG